jgi:dipeptidyl aminopeptidase/acylaminoacyl peptidase
MSDAIDRAATESAADSSAAPSPGHGFTGRHGRLAQGFLHLQSEVRQVAVSVDGTRLAFVVATIDVDENTTRTKVWLDGAPLTAGDHDANPTWSPDGRFLAFTSRRGEKKTETTIHILPVAGPGEPRTVATMTDGVADLAWSPDGRLLAFTSRTPDARYREKDDSWRAPRKMETFLSRLDGEDWIFDRPSHVHVVEADGTGAPRNLTPGPYQHHGVSWLPDSSAVVTSAARRDNWDDDFATDLYLVPVTADAADNGVDDAGEEGAAGIAILTATDGERHSPAVSPDGTRVAFIGYDDMRLYPQNAGIGVIALDPVRWPVSGDDIVWASAGLDRSFECTKGVQAPVWIDDSTLLAIAEDHGDQHLYRLTADGGTAPAAMTSGPITVVAVDASDDHAIDLTVATVRTTATCPGELYVHDTRRTFVSAPVENRALNWEKFTAPTSDGEHEIDAWIMRPRDFDETQSYPVLLNVHGGPFTQYGEYFFDEAQLQASAGFVVVLGNPRGGSGRAGDWGQAILGPKHPVRPGAGWGTVDVDDVLAILDTALDRYPFCDRSRVGMLGGSYGGYMATMLAGLHGHRFRAFCSERAVNNLLSFEWSSDISTMFTATHGVNHLDDPDEYRSRSPINHVDNIDKPMLLIHSDEDWRAPISQAEELWVALKMRDRDVEFYRFPGENHELSRSGSPVHRVQRAELILDWFAEKLSSPD